MKTRVSLLAVISLGLGLGISQAETISVNAHSLGDWNVNGSQPQGVGEEFVLPAGARISRPLPVALLSVRLATQPIFGADAGDAPILEVGPLALAFVCLAGEGRVILVAADGVPRVLAQSVELGSDGSAALPLEIEGDRRHREL